ncbi:MAG: DUF2905 domain-containing protein [Candidatus Omnitrophica bacterium]|nr:DUF2905 domain-containing protein [Candidatus Omnitrophota bacterium]
MPPELGKTFLILGCVFALIGLALMAAPHIPWLGRLPGDLHYRGKNIHVYFPIATCIILSILLTILLSIFRH